MGRRAGAHDMMMMDKCTKGLDIGRGSNESFLASFAAAETKMSIDRDWLIWQ